VALDPAGLAFGEFAFGEGGEEAGGGPAFLVGLLCEGLPALAEARPSEAP
jgi:hypothetical protein